MFSFNFLFISDNFTISSLASPTSLSNFFFSYSIAINFFYYSKFLWFWDTSDLFLLISLFSNYLIIVFILKISSYFDLVCILALISIIFIASSNSWSFVAIFCYRVLKCAFKCSFSATILSISMEKSKISPIVYLIWESLSS